MMKTKLLAVILLLLCPFLASLAQTAFKGYLVSKEHEVFMRIDFHQQNVTVPGQELYGQLPGYLGKQRNNFCWVITSAELTGSDTAEMSLINDFGSEDLKARLTRLNDTTYVFHHLKGSSLKVPKNGKWYKLPKEFKLIKLKD